MKGICNRLTADILSRERLELFSETMCNHGQLLYELSCHGDKRPNRKRIREIECLIWLMVLQGSNLWFLGPMHLGRTSHQWEHLAMIIFGSWWAGSYGTSDRQGPGTRAGSLWVTFASETWPTKVSKTSQNGSTSWGKLFNTWIPLRDILFPNCNMTACLYSDHDCATTVFCLVTAVFTY